MMTSAMEQWLPAEHGFLESEREGQRGDAREMRAGAGSQRRAALLAKGRRSSSGEVPARRPEMENGGPSNPREREKRERGPRGPQAHQERDGEVG